MRVSGWLLCFYIIIVVDCFKFILFSKNKADKFHMKISKEKKLNYCIIFRTIYQHSFLPTTNTPFFRHCRYTPSEHYTLKPYIYISIKTEYCQSLPTNPPPNVEVRNSFIFEIPILHWLTCWWRYVAIRFLKVLVTHVVVACWG